MTVRVEFPNASSVEDRLRAVYPRVRANVAKALDDWAEYLKNYVVENKLSGDPLHRRSGDLAASITAYRNDAGTTLAGGAGGGSGIVYAHIHEFGGTITAKRAPYLTFRTGDGMWHRVKSVVLPERSYMRSSFEEQKADGMAHIRAAVIAGASA